MVCLINKVLHGFDDDRSLALVYILTFDSNGKFPYITPMIFEKDYHGGFGSKWMPKNIPKFLLCSGPDPFHSRDLTYF